jgi:hypothetical protein
VQLGLVSSSSADFLNEVAAAPAERIQGEKEERKGRETLKKSRARKSLYTGFSFPPKTAGALIVTRESEEDRGCNRDVTGIFLDPI